MPATSLPPSAGLPRSSCLEVRPVVFGGNPRVVDLPSRGTSLLCSSWGAPVATSEPGLRQVCVPLLAAGCCIPPFHISPGDNVWVKVVSRAGQRLGLAMRDVDQATGEDLLPMAGGAGRGQPNGAGAGAAPSALHGLSGIKVRGPGFCLRTCCAMYLYLCGSLVSSSLGATLNGKVRGMLWRVGVARAVTGHCVVGEYPR